MRKLRNSAIAVVTATALLAGGTAANAAEGSAAKAFDNSISSTQGDMVYNTDECKDENVTNEGNGSTLPEFNAGSIQNHHKNPCVQKGDNAAGKAGTALQANKAIKADSFDNVIKTTFGKLWVALTVLTGIGFIFAASNFVTHYRLHPIF